MQAGRNDSRHLVHVWVVADHQIPTHQPVAVPVQHDALATRLVLCIQHEAHSPASPEDTVQASAHGPGSEGFGHPLELCHVAPTGATPGAAAAWLNSRSSAAAAVLTS